MGSLLSPVKPPILDHALEVAFPAVRLSANVADVHVWTNDDYSPLILSQPIGFED